MNAAPPHFTKTPQQHQQYQAPFNNSYFYDQVNGSMVNNVSFTSDRTLNMSLNNQSQSQQSLFNNQLNYKSANQSDYSIPSSASAMAMNHPNQPNQISNFMTASQNQQQQPMMAPPPSLFNPKQPLMKPLPSGQPILQATSTPQATNPNNNVILKFLK
jgi:hypothetical protein